MKLTFISASLILLLSLSVVMAINILSPETPATAKDISVIVLLSGLLVLGIRMSFSSLLKYWSKK